MKVQRSQLPKAQISLHSIRPACRLVQCDQIIWIYRFLALGKLGMDVLSEKKNLSKTNSPLIHFQMSKILFI